MLGLRAASGAKLHPRIGLLGTAPTFRSIRMLPLVKLEEKVVLFSGPFPLQQAKGLLRTERLLQLACA
jgi:hypothetical protein